MKQTRSLAGAAILAVVLALTACTRSDLKPDYVRQPSTALAPVADAPIVAEARTLAAGHGDDSGLRLLTNSIDALLARLALADRAKHSIDLQYYIFHGDATGKLVAQHLLAAADRGVRVRVLLDDLHEGPRDAVLHALDGHRNIEIRVFNPFYERAQGKWDLGKQFVGDFSRLNRRMHNKAYIIDGAAAIVGGRNIGDEYFDASGGVNFRDLDILLIGPVVAEVSHVFDAYWNSGPSMPIEAFKHPDVPQVDIDSVRKALEENAAQVRATEYGAGVLTEVAELRTKGIRPHEWAWGPAEFLADDPDKVTPDVDTKDLHLAPHVREWLDGAQKQILLISPYFVPGDKGVAYLTDKRAKGIEVAVLTNSLASTDADAVYAAYGPYRPKLLEAGVRIYELKPNAVRSKKQQHLIASTESSSSLHSKLIVVDDDKAFIGSMNLDPRSHNLNTEDGVLVTSSAIAQDLIQTFKLATDPSVTYEVKLKSGSTSEVYWETKENGETVLFDDAPQTSGWRRFKAGFTRVLPVEGLL
ncbi:MAG TPA: phospholipase D family protein [Rhodanobacteraceae bacterium]|nr:phospholipase D family protein [Rhodanobacteraceae bacterium]